MVWQPLLLLYLAHAIWAQPVTQQLVEDKDVNAINMTEREQKQLQCWIHNASILGKRCIPDTQRCHYQTMHVVEQAGVLDYDLSHVQSRRCTTGCCGMSEGLGRAPGCSVTIDVTGGPPVIDCW